MKGVIEEFLEKIGMKKKPTYDAKAGICLLYTSDAADDLTRVDLGGRRIIKKNFFKQKTAYEITTRLVGSEMCIRDSFPCMRETGWGSGSIMAGIWGTSLCRFCL